MFISFPEVAHTLGCYPKVDCSDGYLPDMTYETFRDF